MAGRTFVKICGVTSTPDAVRAVELGADAIGINLIPTSKRRVTEDVAGAIARAVAGRAVSVAVVADLDESGARALRERTGVDRLQLHGSEPTELVQALAPEAFKAVRLRTPHDVERAELFGGDLLLVDAYVPGQLGGTGQLADWSLAARLARKRAVILAGGLVPGNVADAIQAVSPYGVDVASGVEVPGRPGEKDWLAVSDFIAAARSRDVTA